MQRLPEENWQAVALRAFATRASDASLPASPYGSATPREASYDAGYAWARDRAQRADLRSMVEAGYAAAAQIVRGSVGFSTRDEFGQAAYPSEEMWESFVDGATALYRDTDG